VATGRDDRGDKGEGRGYRTRRCMHGSNRRTDRDTERGRWRDSALKTLRRCGRDANGRRRLNLTIIVRPISHPDIDLNDRYPENRISIHNTRTHNGLQRTTTEFYSTTTDLFWAGMPILGRLTAYQSPSINRNGPQRRCLLPQRHCNCRVRVMVRVRG